MVRIAMLGSGIIAECHYLGLEKTDAKIVAIASVDEGVAQPAREKYGARYYKDYKKLLAAEKENVDAVFVALPNHLHAEACITAMNEGYKYIFCEKPMTIDADDSARLVELAREKEVMFRMGYMKRFNPGFQKIKEAMETIGKVSFATFSIYFGGPEPEPEKKGEPGHWYGDPKKSGGGCLVHNGSHQIDLLRYLLGEVVAVSAHMDYESDGGEYQLRAQLETERGIVADMRIGRIDVPDMGPDFTVFRDGWNETVEIIGSRGYIKCESPTWQGYEPIRVKQWKQHAPGPSIDHYDCAEQWINEMKAFVSSVSDSNYKCQASTDVDGYRDDYIMRAIRISAKNNGERIVMDYKF